MGGRSLRGLAAGPKGGRNEEVVVAMVAPVEMGAGWAVPHLNHVVVGSVDNDGLMVAAREHVGVLFIAPFSVRA